MIESSNDKKYERKVTPLERMFTRAPYAVVTVVARIKGNVSEDMLIKAVSKVQQRHPNLRVRIKDDDNHQPWFTSEEVGDIPIEIVPRGSDEHWIQVYHKACRIPFEFDTQPAIRFILVQSPSVSELIIMCHHIICDGMSLAYLARDLMNHLGDPTRGVEILPDPEPITSDTIPQNVSLNPIIKFFVNRMNKKWENDKIFFDQEDYRDLNEAYWTNFTHHMLTVELSEAETSTLVERCRNKGVTVNTALTAAFAGAQTVVQGDKPYHSKIAIAGSLRDRLPKPAGEVMGFYAGLVTPKFKYNRNKGFWENAQRLHQKAKGLYTDKNLFMAAVFNAHFESAIREATTFKMLGKLVPAHASRYEKISSFSTRDDVVLGVIKRRKVDSPNNIIMGLAVTNLTRLDFPREYDSLELDRLYMNPGSGAPLGNINLIVGVVTCAGKLSLVLEYAEESVDTETMEKIKDKAMEFLLNA